MSNLTAVKANNLNLKYRFIKAVNIKKEISRLVFKKKSSNKIKEIWALKNINFEAKKGKTIGLIGPNGAGKTTLLKTISKIFEPDSGTVDLFSNSVSLLTLGAGFYPELTGTENIYLNGLLLGFNKREIDKKMEEIVSFSELREYIHFPIKTYSSGMRVRLAFSISSHIEPDILLIDEILGVGDETFRIKSQNKIKDLIANKKRTVFIASHSLTSIIDLCDLVLWLNKGEVVDFDEPNKIIEKYKIYYKR